MGRSRPKVGTKVLPIAPEGVFVVEVDTLPDRLGRVSFTATWVTAEGRSKGQCFHMVPQEFVERAGINGYEVVGFDAPAPMTLEAMSDGS